MLAFTKQSNVVPSFDDPADKDAAKNRAVHGVLSHIGMLLAHPTGSEKTAAQELRQGVSIFG